MVRHQAISSQINLEELGGFFEDFKEDMIIVVDQIDRGSGVAPVHHVIPSIRVLNPKRSCDGNTPY